MLSSTVLRDLICGNFLNDHYALCVLGRINKTLHTAVCQTVLQRQEQLQKYMDAHYSKQRERNPCVAWHAYGGACAFTGVNTHESRSTLSMYIIRMIGNRPVSSTVPIITPLHRDEWIFKSWPTLCAQTDARTLEPRYRYCFFTTDSAVFVPFFGQHDMLYAYGSISKNHTEEFVEYTVNNKMRLKKQPCMFTFAGQRHPLSLLCYTVSQKFLVPFLCSTDVQYKRQKKIFKIDGVCINNVPLSQKHYSKIAKIIVRLSPKFSV
jgi:hypothetical protein